MIHPRGLLQWRVAQRIAGAKTVTVGDAGHMMMVEKPDETLDEMIAALSTGAAGS